MARRKLKLVSVPAPGTPNAELLNAGLLHRYHVRYTQRMGRGAIARDAVLFALVVAVIATNVILGVWR